VHPGNAHPKAFSICTLTYPYVEITTGAKGFVVLTYLEVLGHIWVEVVLAGEASSTCDLAIHGKADSNRCFDGCSICNGQRTGQPQTNRANVRICLSPEVRRAPAEHFRISREFDMGF
jgi:hypothetical protein